MGIRLRLLLQNKARDALKASYSENFGLLKTLLRIVKKKKKKAAGYKILQLVIRAKYSKRPAQIVGF